MNFELQNITIVGAFNTAIIHPNWLKEQGIYSDAINSGFNPSTGVIQHLFVKENINWEVSKNRFVVSSKNIAENLEKSRLQFLVEIFKKLQYTPIIAIGYNLRLRASEKTSQKLQKVREMLDQQPLNWSFTHKRDWQGVLVAHIAEHSDQGGLETSLFNFERRLNPKAKIATVIEEFFRDLPKMREYANNNG